MRSRLRSPRPSLVQTRRNIAGLAARLMAEDGIEDYGLAKRKAARQLHQEDSNVLPTNAEIEAELRAYQALYQGGEHQERIESLRQVALRAMRLLKDFSPYLTGHVLEGTAARYAAIDLVLFTDSLKDVELLLLARHIEYRHIDLRRPGGDGESSMIECEFEGFTVRIAVLGADEERLRRRSPHSGRVFERASLATLAAMLGQAA